MKTYIECTLKEDASIVMNVEAFKNIEYLNKDLWTIQEKYAKELPHLHVFGDAKVCGDAQVYENAVVFENTYVFGDAHVHGSGRVYGNAYVYGNAIVYDYARVYDYAIVCGNARAKGEARVYRHARVCGDAQVSENAQVYGSGRVYGNAYVCGNARVYRNALVDGHSELRGDAIATTKTYNINFLKWNTTLSDNHISIGCKQWTYEQFLRFNEIYIGIEYSQEEYSEMIPAKDILIDAIKLKRPDLFKKEEK